MTLELIKMIIFILLGTKVAGHLCNRFNLPVVFGELTLGLLLGPAILNMVQETDGIAMFSEIGIILLMFLVGLESDLNLLRRYLKPAIIVATFGVFVPFIFIAILGHLIGMGTPESFFLGIIFSATSLSITVQVLKEYDYLDNEAGSITLGAAILDDTLVVILISIFTAVVTFDASVGFTATMAWDLIGKKVLFFFIMYLVAKYFITPAMNLSSKMNAIKAKTAMALVLCFAFTIFAEEMGLSDIIGSFFIGLMLSSHEHSHEIETDIDTIGNSLFIPVFFVSIGLGINIEALYSQFGLIFLLSLGAILTKLMGGYFAARLMKVNRKSSFVIGSGMVSRGEMALIVAKIGQESGFITNEFFTVVIAAIIITTLISPLLLKFSIGLEQNDNDEVTA
ncbi:cation:proton antiporter [Vagococcus carniphilus]|uniref:Sodium:proton antiporter n=1 Tax=Vagococcus carniphilus TaxID=218144 RepID=A0A430AQZ2_9ENTE|nr:cation:proton antiporter [Vagococcus carniphilus]QNN72228.1 cation:proton antiporter [Vagococcus carniphilus]RSU10560.1 sodium:proton antiporter [Vagococcus carniphilus]